MTSNIETINTLCGTEMQEHEVLHRSEPIERFGGAVLPVYQLRCLDCGQAKYDRWEDELTIGVPARTDRVRMSCGGPVGCIITLAAYLDDQAKGVLREWKAVEGVQDTAEFMASFHPAFPRVRQFRS